MLEIFFEIRKRDFLDDMAERSGQKRQTQKDKITKRNRISRIQKIVNVSKLNYPDRFYRAERQEGPWNNFITSIIFEKRNTIYLCSR